MKPILDKTQSIYYIDNADMIRFIEINSDMKWNDICDFIRNNDIGPCEYGPVLWEKSELIETPKEFNEEQVYWVGAFFDAHPWIERMMIVFND